MIIFALAAVFIFYAALALAPLTIINVIVKLDSFIVLVLAFLINREPIIPIEALGMFICFGAIVAMAISSEKDHKEAGPEGEIDETETDINLRMLGILMAVVVALFGGTIPILTRRL